jgi:DNA-binding transcriptional ArsR family regulator
MSKVTLDMATFKALASDTRLEILRTLDGKKLSLNDICTATNLNKATLHEHLQKLNEAGLVIRREREGHKWVYYKLTWKGEGLLHPENTKIVVLFTTTFIILFFGIVSMVNFIKGTVIGRAVPVQDTESLLLYSGGNGIPISNLTLRNTPTYLSDLLIKKSELRGIFGNTINKSNLQWKSTSGEIIDNMKNLAQNSEKLYKADELVSSNSDKTTGTIFAIFHDPYLQYIAIICITIFLVFLIIGIWRLYKNKTPKL